MASGFKNEMDEQLRIHELHENLKKAEVGDLVVITYTEAVAISVEKTTVE